MPQQHHDDEFEELHEYPGRPEDKDLEDGDVKLDDVPQDGDDHDQELQEEGDGYDCHEEAAYGAEV
ncbi:hypothetical protein SLS64_004565 [Diaporthe eres]|uniref:Uncharacterized protein n=1 Tax=Diaporthe eres TaxID=83184 RepID=A0ABR1PJD6_DIAER